MPMLTRRQMLLTAGAGAAALLLPKLPALAEETDGFKLPPLPYPVDALEPHIDAETMTIHHDKHHKAYVDNLNKAVAGTDWAKMPIEDVVAKVKEVPEAKRQAVINNGGGPLTHSMFWTLMAPASKSGEPKGELARAIEAVGGMDKLKKTVADRAAARFGSGWVWIVVGKQKELNVVDTANQDNPLMVGVTPTMGIDVGEHA